MYKSALLLVLLLLQGCGGGSGGSTPPSPSPEPTPPLSSEPYYYQQWYLECDTKFCQENAIETEAGIHVAETLKRYTGEGVKIAIIDDGFDLSHPELKDTKLAAYNSATEGSDVAHTESDGFHGTAVAGIIVAQKNGQGILGMAHNSKIIYLKYKEEMSDSETITLFNKAASYGADIINCSWGTGDVSQAVKDTIVTLAKSGRGGKGILIVFSTGNDNAEMGNDESAIPEVIAVGATSEKNLRATYSNYGAMIDLLAPGGEQKGIATLDESGAKGIAVGNEDYLLTNALIPFSGTSASAPIMSAAIALLLEKDPTLDRDQVETLLHDTSDKIGTLPYEKGFNTYYGYGKLNLRKLLGE